MTTQVIITGTSTNDTLPELANVSETATAHGLTSSFNPPVWVTNPAEDAAHVPGAARAWKVTGWVSNLHAEPSGIELQKARGLARTMLGMWLSKGANVAQVDNYGAVMNVAMFDGSHIQHAA